MVKLLESIFLVSIVLLIVASLMVTLDVPENVQLFTVVFILPAIAAVFILERSKN